MVDLAFRSAKQLAADIRRKKIGCLELLDHYLARVEKYNPKLNAIVVRRTPIARRARARTRTARSRKGESWGPLHGVPMTIKESFDVAGHADDLGLAPTHRTISRRNALAVERLLAAGAVLFGKTNVPLWLADWQSFNAIYGTHQ